MSQELHDAKSAVVTVGGGRGFVVNGPRNRLVVVTAAHWLPFLSSWRIRRREKLQIARATG
jgi:hypothetical protein